MLPFISVVNIMDRCRICLLERETLFSISEQSGDQTLAYMLTSLSKVKIMEVSDKICAICRKSLIDSFNFKILIERSDEILQNRIHFNNFEDIKTSFVVNDQYRTNLQPKTTIPLFMKGETSFTYNNTTIKKLELMKLKMEDEFFTNEIINHFDNVSDTEYPFENAAVDDYKTKPEDNTDFDLPLRQRRKKINTHKQVTTRRKKSVMQKVLLKPVILNDFQLIHKVKQIRDRKKKKYYVMCNYCGKMTNQMKRHELTHTGQRSFKCDTCSRGFYTKIELKKHILSVHQREKLVKCEQCTATVNSESELKRHMLSHCDVKPFTCDICSKSFKRKGAVKRHRLIHNIVNKSFKCDLCSMSFFTKANLNHHIRVHTRERPYNCEICSQPYSYKHDFNRHCFNKHGVFLKRRSVFIMNEEVLKRERALMQNILLKIRGLSKENEPLNPFDGPQAAQAFAQAVKVLESKKIPIDYSY